jgi:hypothetical protein
VLKYFGLSIRGNNNLTLKNRIKIENIDDSHIRNKKIGLNLKSFIAKPIEDYLSNKIPAYNKDIKPRLLKLGLLENKCDECGLGPEWNGKPLTIQLDHIDGNHKNFNLINLRMLCPNCHTQTKTFGSKGLKIGTNCKYCNCELRRKFITGLCKDCYNKAAHDVDFNILIKNIGITVKLQLMKMVISKEDLEKLVSEKSLTQIGKIYKISANAVKKRCNTLGINWKNKGKYQ